MDAARPLLMLTALLLASQAHAVTIDWVTVGDPNNTADTTGYGAVDREYRIGKYEVTIGQYTDFLNAVAATDPYGLYNTSMASTLSITGISQGGSDGSYTYSVIGSSGDKPITYVSWFDAARFANWMHNGQGSGSTETGAYTLSGAMSGNAVAKNTGAILYIPTEDEWYKAAYYKGGGTNAGYWSYATQSDTEPTAVSVGPTGMGSAGSTGNFANYGRGGDGTSQPGNATTVGTNGGASHYGAFDMSGNVWEWNDFDGLAETGSSRGLRGGGWLDLAFILSSSINLGSAPSGESMDLGFRLAAVAVPEPSTWVMGLAGIACAGWGMQRRRSLTGERRPSTSQA
jgi:sulfatase modifying factor 1